MKLMPDLTDFMVEKEDDSYYGRLSIDKNYLEILPQTEQNFIKEIERFMAHNFRYYQKEALSIFDYFYRISRDL